MKRPGRFLLLWLLAALSPLWLGPLLTPMRIAAAATTHLCACGMAEGTCGCPECDEQALDRAVERASDAPPALKGECGRGQSFVGDAHLPPAVLPPAMLVAPVAAVALAVTFKPRVLASIASRAPPIRPPRLA